MAVADIGAAAYAKSVEDSTFSTQEVILSMLHHDTRFKAMLREGSSNLGLDHINVEFAVADTHRHCLALDQAESTKGILSKGMVLNPKRHWGTKEGKRKLAS